MPMQYSARDGQVQSLKIKDIHTYIYIYIYILQSTMQDINS